MPVILKWGYQSGRNTHILLRLKEPWNTPRPWVFMLARVKNGQPRLRELQDDKHKSKQKQEQA